MIHSSGLLNCPLLIQQSSNNYRLRTGQANHVPQQTTPALTQTGITTGVGPGMFVSRGWPGMAANQKRNKIRICAPLLLSSLLPPYICSRLEKVTCRDEWGREQTIVIDRWMTKTKLQGSACMPAYIHTELNEKCEGIGIFLFLVKVYF